MANFNHDRVQHALRELLIRVVPDDPNEDEDTANERFENALDYALEELVDAGEPNIVPDINHVASLIDRRISRGVQGTQQSSRFHNLLSRLISQPVLDQKWRMLYFLLQLSDVPAPEPANWRGRGTFLSKQTPPPSSTRAPAGAAP